MLRIEHMRMRLPKGFEHRASSIARLLGHSMADFEPSENRTLDSVSIGPVQVAPNATDEEIANGIAERIELILGRGI